MTVVVDIGCVPRGREESVQRLTERFQPHVLYGFDPDPELVEGVEYVGADGRITVIIRRRLAAWTYDGVAPIVFDGICTGIDKKGETLAQCFDLAPWLRSLPVGMVVLKLDCEGAEYPILQRIHKLGIDQHLGRILVEWHPRKTAHGWGRRRPVLDCPVEEW